MSLSNTTYTIEFIGDFPGNLTMNDNSTVQIAKTSNPTHWRTIVQSTSASAAQNCSFQAIDATGNLSLYLEDPIVKADAALSGSVNPSFFDVWPASKEEIELNGFDCTQDGSIGCLRVFNHGGLALQNKHGKAILNDNIRGDPNGIARFTVV